MAVTTEREKYGAGEDYQIGVRKAEGDGRDSLKFVGNYEVFDEMTDGELFEETEGPLYDRELENGDLRVITSGKAATLHFFPDEELTDEGTVYGLTNEDAEVRKEYREGLEPLYDLAGGEEELGRLLEQLQ